MPKSSRRGCRRIVRPEFDLLDGGTLNSNERFGDLMRWPETSKATRTPPKKLTAVNGADLGVPKHNTHALTIISRNTDGFDYWLAENISQVHPDWESREEQSLRAHSVWSRNRLRKARIGSDQRKSPEDITSQEAQFVFYTSKRALCVDCCQ